MRWIPNQLRVLALAAVAAAACGSEPPSAPSRTFEAEPVADPAADSVYRGGRIYTLDGRRPWVSAVAIKDGWFIGVGTDAEVEPLIGRQTEVHDLGGRMAMPGLFDLDASLLTAIPFDLIGLAFTDPFSIETMLEELRAFAAAHPEKRWLRGGVWGTGVFPEDAPTKQLLDAVVPDRPVVLVDEQGRSYWLNSKALEQAGITRDGEATDGVVIVRDALTREPTGTLRELALRLVERVAERPTPEEFAPVLESQLRAFASLGVTSIQTSETNFRALDAVQRLDREGRLPVRVFASWAWRTTWITPYTDRELDSPINERVRYESKLVSPNFVSIFVDGQPAGHGALLLEPYSDDSGQLGSARVSRSELRDDVVLLDRRGIGAAIGAVGDGAVNVALDAIEAARQANGNTGVRHQIVGPKRIDLRDVARLGRISGVSVVISPGGPFPTRSLQGGVAPLFGEARYQAMWPVRSLLKARAFVGYGSGGLASAPASPWQALEGFVTRRNPDAPELGSLGGDEAVTLEQALQIFTLAGAWAVGEDVELGSIAVGKQADMIVLDRNLFDVPVEEIHQTRVTRTVVAGNVVFDR